MRKNVVYGSLPWQFFVAYYVIGAELFGCLTFILYYFNNLLKIPSTILIIIVVAIWVVYLLLGLSLFHHKLVVNEENNYKIWYGPFFVKFHSINIFLSDKFKYRGICCDAKSFYDEKKNKTYFLFTANKEKKMAKDLAKQQDIKLSDKTDYQEIFTKLEKNSVYFEKSKTVKHSKFGGKPDLPKDFVWPMFKGSVDTIAPCEIKERPLSFLMQIDLEEIAPYDLNNMLPQKGMLYLFYDYLSSPVGNDLSKGNNGGLKVYYYENIKFDELVKSTYDFPKEEWESDMPFWKFKEYYLKFKSKKEVPKCSEDAYQYGGDDFKKYIMCNENYTEKAEASGYSNVRCNENFCANKIGGYDDYCQGEANSDIKNMVLLFQLISDYPDGFSISSNGNLYVFIDKEKLKNKDFSSCYYTYDYT